VVNLVVALILGSHDHGHEHQHTGENHEHHDHSGHDNVSVRKDLNLNSAFLHVLGDAISSVGVILAAILIKATGINWIDPLMSVLIGCIILVSAFRVLRGSLRILVEGVPEGLSITKINQCLCDLPGVASVHDLHVWNICSGTIAMSAHIVLNRSQGLDEPSEMHKIKEMLTNEFKIEHTTIQFEECPCMNGQGGCN
jgi:cobalt-zinc-cadmium efflux system protein